MDDELDRAFQAVLDGWDDPETHRRYLVLADVTGRLAHAGQRYREVRDTDPARRAEASRRIDEVLALGVARIRVVEGSEPSRARRRLEWVGLGLSAVLMAAALWQLVR